MRPLIIESPNLQDLRQRYAFAALTLVFWVVWFYLWIPLVSLVAWLMGIEVFYDQMILLDGLRGLRDLLGWYGLVIALLGLSLGGWAWYNFKRFGGREKRRDSPLLEPEAIAGHFGLTEGQLAAAKSAQRLVIVHDDGGWVSELKGTGQDSGESEPGAQA
jgi:biofilm PGA synthesis protein PgaD